MAKASNSTSGRRRFLSFIPFIGAATVAGPVVAVEREPLAALWRERERLRLIDEEARQPFETARAAGADGERLRELLEPTYATLGAFREAHDRFVNTRAGTPAGVQLKLRLYVEAQRSGAFWKEEGYCALLQSAIEDLGQMHAAK